MDSLLHDAEQQLAQRGQHSRQNLNRADSIGSVDSNYGSDDAEAQQAKSSEQQATDAQEGRGYQAGQTGARTEPQRASKSARKRVRQQQNRAAKLADSAQAAFLQASGQPVPAEKPPSRMRAKKRSVQRKRAAVQKSFNRTR